MHRYSIPLILRLHGERMIVRDTKYHFQANGRFGFGGKSWKLKRMVGQRVENERRTLF